MPRYRFEFREEDVNPPIFVDLDDDEAARREALQVTRQTMLDGLAEGVDPTDWMTRVYNEAGYLVGTVTFGHRRPSGTGSGSTSGDGSEGAEIGMTQRGRSDMSDRAQPPKKRRTRTAKGEDFEVKHLAETTDLSPKQARDLLRKYGNDWRKLEEEAKTFKAEG